MQGKMKGCLVLIAFFGVLFIGLYFYFKFGYNNCIRQIPDGTVRCKCEFDSSESWDAYLDKIKGGYEDVIVDDPNCGK